jgi:hypothetical protein
VTSNNLDSYLQTLDAEIRCAIRGDRVNMLDHRRNRLIYYARLTSDEKVTVDEVKNQVKFILRSA